MDQLDSKKPSCFLHLGIHRYLFEIYWVLQGMGHKVLFNVGDDEYKRAQAAEVNEINLLEIRLLHILLMSSSHKELTVCFFDSSDF